MLFYQNFFLTYTLFFVHYIVDLFYLNTVLIFFNDILLRITAKRKIMIEFQSNVHTIVHFFSGFIGFIEVFFLHVYFLKYANDVWIFYVLSVVHNSLTRITVFDYFF